MYQKIEIIGHLGRDPELRYTPSGEPVTTFSVATGRKFTRGGQQVNETVWFRVSTWGKTAEACNQYLHKGSLVFVEGRLSADEKTGSPRIWRDRDGAARTNFEIVASTVRFLSRKDDAANVPTAELTDEQAEDEEHIPF